MPWTQIAFFSILCDYSTFITDMRGLSLQVSVHDTFDHLWRHITKPLNYSFSGDNLCAFRKIIKSPFTCLAAICRTDMEGVVVTKILRMTLDGAAAHQNNVCFILFFLNNNCVRMCICQFAAFYCVHHRLRCHWYALQTMNISCLTNIQSNWF